MIAVSSSNEADRYGSIAASVPNCGWYSRSTPAWARWVACTIACTSAIIWSWCCGVARTHSACSARHSASTQGRQCCRRASQTTITRPFRVGALGGAVIGCRPTTSAREASIACTGASFTEVTSSHKRSCSRPADRRVYSAINADVCRMGAENTSTSACSSSCSGACEPGSAGSWPITCTCMCCSKKRVSQRP
ncbi:hypothetical protein D3C73_1168460 [compost metagenome]